MKTQPQQPAHTKGESERDKDILKLCNAVLDISPSHFDNPNGGYETSCPFCLEEESRGGGGKIWAEMSELKHQPYCAYLIAKDLSTNLLKQAEQK